MNGPLSFKEIMYIDKNVLERAEIIHKNYYRDFFTNKKAENAPSVMLFTGYPLMIETEKYYNGELLSTYALFKSMREFNMNYRVTAYYFENLIFRIISFWEYLYQFLNMHFQLKLYDDRAMKRIIDISGYTPKFIPEGRGHRLELVPKPREEQKKIRKSLQQRLGKINKYNIICYIAGIYEVTGNLEKLLGIIANNNVEIIKKVRNEIIHQRPGGASFTVNFDDFTNDYTVSINNNGWIEFDIYDMDIERCMKFISDAIQSIHEIVMLNEYPNKIENTGKEYFVKRIKCSSCNGEFLAPSLLLGDNDEFVEAITCPLCGKLGGEVISTVRITEVDYGTKLGEYFRAIEKLNEEINDL